MGRWLGVGGEAVVKMGVLGERLGCWRVAEVGWRANRGRRWKWEKAKKKKKDIFNN